MNHEDEIDLRERLTQLWLEAEPSVQAFVFVAVNRVQDAEDVVQQVALTVARRFDQYDGSRPFIVWTLWLAKSRIADLYRKQGRERLVFSEALLNQLSEAMVHQQPGRTARHEALEHCLDKLPEKSRQLLALRYEEDAPSIWVNHEASVCRSDRSIAADADVATWQRVAVPLVAPPDADFLVIECAVVSKGPKVQGPTKFPGHYVDQVELRLNATGTC